MTAKTSDTTQAVGKKQTGDDATVAWKTKAIEQSRLMLLRRIASTPRQLR